MTSPTAFKKEIGPFSVTIDFYFPFCNFVGSKENVFLLLVPASLKSLASWAFLSVTSAAYLILSKPKINEFRNNSITKQFRDYNIKILRANVDFHYLFLSWTLFFDFREPEV